MTTKTTQNTETMATTQNPETTAKRTRKVIKWESAFDAFTCEMFGLLMANKDKDKDLSIVMRKYQLCLRAVCEMVKTSKKGEIQNEIDNLDLALTVASITDKTVVERLNQLVELFR